MASSELTYFKLTDSDLNQINEDLAVKDTLDVIRWAYQNYQDELIYACSFGAEGIVLLDLIQRVRPDAHIVFLDTNKHFKETYELIDKVKNRYPKLQIQMVNPNLSLEQQAEIHGEELWNKNPDLCCSIRKIQPLTQTLSGSKAWMSGLRREQSPTRATVQYVNRDHRFQSIKVCPLIHWKWNDIWEYIKLYNLDYNPLHDLGYPSIGCETCTLPVEGGGDSREGRWAKSGKTECGLHQ